MMMKRYFLIINLILVVTTHSQNADSLIQLYPGLGDTLTHFDRTYLGLFQEIENFEYALFYLHNKDSLLIKIYTSENDSVKEKVIVSKLKTLDSLQSVIRQIDLINTQLKNERPEFFLITKESNAIEGNLEMFDENFIYVIASDVSADHPGTDRYRISVSRISEITLEGTSNVLMGMCIGGAAGAIIGAIVGTSINEDEKNQTNNCLSDMDDEVNAAAAFVAITLGGFLVGTVIGASTSTEDNVIYFDSKMDVLKLKRYCAYVLDKEVIKEKKYFDIY
jgi:hypothetical protein